MGAVPQGGEAERRYRADGKPAFHVGASDEQPEQLQIPMDVGQGELYGLPECEEATTTADRGCLCLLPGAMHLQSRDGSAREAKGERRLQQARRIR